MWGYTEGDRALDSYHFQDLCKTLNEITDKNIENIDIGTRVFFGSHHKKWQHIYEVLKTFERNGDTYYSLNQVTKTGKLSKRKKAKISIKKRVLLHFCYLITDESYSALKTFKHSTKSFYPTGNGIDYQRSKVYRAERNISKELKEIRFDDTKEAEEYLEKIYKIPAVNQLNPDIKNITVKINNRIKRKADANHYNGTIRIAGDSKSFGLQKRVILHEFAHLLAPGDQHRSKFTTKFLQLSKIEFPELFRELLNNYQKYDIDFDEEVVLNKGKVAANKK